MGEGESGEADRNRKRQMSTPTEIVTSKGETNKESGGW